MPRGDGESQEYRAIHRYAPFSARKAKPMVDLIRGKTVDAAIEELLFVNRRAAPALRKLLESAVANAGQVGGVQAKDLFVKSCCANEGPLKQRRKRFRPGPRGRAMPILKRSAHLEVVLGVREDKKPARRRSAKAKAATASAPKAE
ncbi:MAG TPA: 50S ribosomal protein L22 [Planctomycetota bacterium]|nr:50S ribosomal protein L22 [Planctomycetota bacterium]